MIAYQIAFESSRFDYGLDDYVYETIYGRIYTSKEEAEKHMNWYNAKYLYGCRVIEVKIYEKCEKV